MIYEYPYKTNLKKQLGKLKEGKDYYLWRSGKSIQKCVNNIDLPIVEIGGPTETGFFFLDNIRMKSKPVITNITLNPLPYSPKANQFAQKVVEQVDGTNLKYNDGSIGIFMMAAMSLSSDWWVELDDEAKELESTKFEKEFKIARLEMGQVAVGVLDPKDIVYAQRIKIYQEIYRTLIKGGLLFTDGGIEEIIILQKLGFKIIELLQQSDENNGFHYSSYEFVAQK